MKYSDEEYFQKYMTESSKVSRVRIKRKIIDSKLLEEKCKICAIGDVWNGERLILVLDHINGISNDYRLENLRLLCPNCNSQQDTFAGNSQQDTFAGKNKKRLRELRNK